MNDNELCVPPTESELTALRLEVSRYLSEEAQLEFQRLVFQRDTALQELKACRAFIDKYGAIPTADETRERLMRLDDLLPNGESR